MLSISHFDGGFGGRLAGAGDFADAFQPGPVMTVLKPADVGGDSGRPGFEPPIIGVGGGIGVTGPTLGIIEKQGDVRM